MSNKKRHGLLMLLVIMLCVTGCDSDGLSSESLTMTDSLFPTAEELEPLELLIRNATHTGYQEYRTVTDEELKKTVMELCLQAKPYRPMIQWNDVMIGEQNSEYSVRCVFKNEDVAYIFTFTQASKQLDIDYIHRDAPLIFVNKSILADQADIEEGWAWYGVMNATDYGMLYKELWTYQDGEVVDP